MDRDENVCLCFHVSLRKLTNYMNREKPTVASQLSECLGAGTGCHWCVPFLKQLHDQWQQGKQPDLPICPSEYASRRGKYRSSGKREEEEEK